MGEYRLLVRANAVPGREAEFDEWYDRIHLGEVLALPGFSAAQRFEVRGEPFAGSGGHRYVTLYELDTDDPEVALRGLRRALASRSLTMSDALDLDTVSAVVIESITERVLPK
jgi:hypothetical protein